MGMLDREPPVADVIGLPYYVVDSAVRRDLGTGIISIINCRTIDGLCIPQCEIIIAAAHLLPLCRSASDFAAEIYRRHQIMMLEAVGRRH